MSYENYLIALEKAKDCKGYVHNSVYSEEIIASVEKELDIVFSKQLRNFYGEYGHITFRGGQFFDLDPDDEGRVHPFFDENGKEIKGAAIIDWDGNLLKYTLSLRANFDFPREWIPIIFIDNDTWAYLDFSSINDDGEPRIVSVYYSDLWREDIPDEMKRDGLKIENVLAEDFGDYLLMRVDKILAYYKKDIKKSKSLFHRLFNK